MTSRPAATEPTDVRTPCFLLPMNRLKWMWQWNERQSTR